MNSDSIDVPTLPTIVLIDTWWNVNFRKSWEVLVDYMECESLSDLLKVYIANRFNRYMVECEFYQILLYQGHIFVLIDTWWNVNNLISKY